MSATVMGYSVLKHTKLQPVASSHALPVAIIAQSSQHDSLSFSVCLCCRSPFRLGYGAYHHLGSGLHSCSTPWPAGIELLMHLLCKNLVIYPILFFFAVYVPILRTQQKSPFASRELDSTWQVLKKSGSKPASFYHFVAVHLWLGTDTGCCAGCYAPHAFLACCGCWLTDRHCYMELSLTCSPRNQLLKGSDK